MRLGEVGVQVNREGSAVEQDVGVLDGDQRAGKKVDVGEIGEAGGEAAGEEEVPVEELEGADEAVLEGEPARADEGVGATLRPGKLREDSEEGLVGEEEGPVDLVGEIGDLRLV